MTLKEETEKPIDEQQTLLPSIRYKVQDDLLRIKEKSEDDFEKNIIYIAAGTLVLSLTFIEKIVDLGSSSGIAFLIISWILLSITLLGNLVSHQISSFFHEKYRSLYANCADDDQLPDLKLKQYNFIIASFNWGTLFTLCTGIGMLVTFCSINAYQKANNKFQTETMSTKENQPQTNQPDTQKGRTISRPTTRPAQQPIIRPAQTPPKTTK